MVSFNKQQESAHAAVLSTHLNDFTPFSIKASETAFQARKKN